MKKVSQSKVNTVDDVVSIIDRSTTVHLNTSQRYLNGEGFKYYNFKDYFQKFKKLPNIQKYQHFYFTYKHPGIVFYKDRPEDNYNEATICNFSFNFLIYIGCVFKKGPQFFWALMPCLFLLNGSYAAGYNASSQCLNGMGTWVVPIPLYENKGGQPFFCRWAT